MKRALVAVLLAALAGAAKAVPTQALLDDVATWTFLTEAQRSTLADAQKALQKGEWKKALDFNEDLLAQAPDSIYEVEPRLPLVLIRPAGSTDIKPQKVVAGWQWKLECSQLALLALDWEGVIRRATLVRDASPELHAAACRVMAQARARQGRFVDAQKFIAEADRIDKLGRDEWQIWEQARLGTVEAKVWLDQIGIGSESGIGLPGTQPTPPTAPPAQRTEACLVLGDWAARSGQDQLAAGYYDRALKIATKRNLSGLLAVTLWKRVKETLPTAGLR
jgi:tetratricopeptide (TPR) repeat protein